jgi:Family of unknown function (DUF6186)
MSTRHIAELGFVVIGLIGVVFQSRAISSRRRGQSADRGPITIGEAVSSAMTSRAGKLVVLGWWWWLGWHFLAR